MELRWESDGGLEPQVIPETWLGGGRRAAGAIGFVWFGDGAIGFLCFNLGNYIKLEKDQEEQGEKYNLNVFKTHCARHTKKPTKHSYIVSTIVSIV